LERFCQRFPQLISAAPQRGASPVARKSPHPIRAPGGRNKKCMILHYLLPPNRIKGEKTMPDNYSQISIQLVFAVKYREALILPEHKDRIVQYIIGIIRRKKQQSLAVNAVSDHIHIFFGMDPTIYIPDFVRDIKSDSSLFINENKLSRKTFHWQSGYGVFSYTRSHRPRVIRYIENQEEHHKENSFRREYLKILERNSISYNPQYLFEFFE
jgi:putative transposase